MSEKSRWTISKEKANFLFKYVFNDKKIFQLLWNHKKRKKSFEIKEAVNEALVILKSNRDGKYKHKNRCSNKIWVLGVSNGNCLK